MYNTLNIRNALKSLTLENQAQWPIEQPLLANSALEPTPADITATTDVFQAFLKICYRTGLFRMATVEEVQQNRSYLNTGQNQIPGLIMMRLGDHGQNYGGEFRHLATFFSAGIEQVTFTDARCRDLRYILIRFKSSLRMER